MSKSGIFQNVNWIGVPSGEYEDKPDQSHGIETAYFTRVFNLDTVVPTALSISASSRYRMWINGRYALSGPCKGNRFSYYYDTLDINEYLINGENLIAIKVVSYPAYEDHRNEVFGPQGVLGRAAGPCLCVSGKFIGADISTGLDGWKVKLDTAVSWHYSDLTTWLGYNEEEMDAAKLPAGWNCESSVSGGWAAAKNLWEAYDNNNDPMYGLIPPFPLCERPIPFMREEIKMFESEMPQRDEGAPAFSFLQGNPPVWREVDIPPKSKAVAVLNAGTLKNGYFGFRVKGGKGGRINIRYVESYMKLMGVTLNGKKDKGVRDDYINYDLIGYEDSYMPSGGDDAHMSFSRRVFRFVRIYVETSDEAMTLYPPDYIESGYPLDVKSAIDSPSKWVARLWDISARTLKLCMNDTYEDCPYYEQMQYTLDTRLEIQFTYLLSGDTRMARRALFDFHATLQPDGMIQSRVPVGEWQVIPNFALEWIMTLEEYYQQTGDTTLPRRYRPTVDAILDWYERKQGNLGLVENLGYWSDANKAKSDADDNLRYSLAMRAAATINRITGRKGVAEEYEQRADAINNLVEKYCWDNESGLYKQGPYAEKYSQQTQFYAVLAGLADGEKAKGIIHKTINDNKLTRCAIVMNYFLFRALEKCGLYGAYAELLLNPWKKMIENNLTTTHEHWEIGEDGRHTRSDCHAWTALPIYEFTRKILGVNPEAPGWEGIKIKPEPLSLPSAKGGVITPKGIVNIDWERADGVFNISFDAPDNTPVTLVMPDGSERYYKNGGSDKVSCPDKP